MDDFKGRIVHPQTWPEDLDYRRQEDRRDRLRRDRGDADPGDRRQVRARHHAAALADLLPHRPQRHRARRRAAPAADRRGMDPRDRAPQDPVRAGRVHPPLVHRAGGGEAGTARRRRAALLGPDYDVDKHFTPSYRPWRQRIAFVPDADLFKAISERQGLGRHRRDRALHRERHPAQVRRGAGGRHHRHRDRLQPQRARRHRVRRSTASRWISPTPSPIAA